MLIRNNTTDDLKGQKRIAQGIILGRQWHNHCPKRAKALARATPSLLMIGNGYAFALSGRGYRPFHTQGVALGYELLAFQAVSRMIADRH